MEAGIVDRDWGFARHARKHHYSIADRWFQNQRHEISQMCFFGGVHFQKRREEAAGKSMQILSHPYLQRGTKISDQCLIICELYLTGKKMGFGFNTINPKIVQMNGINFLQKALYDIIGCQCIIIEGLVTSERPLQTTALASGIPERPSNDHLIMDTKSCAKQREILQNADAHARTVWLHHRLPGW